MQGDVDETRKILLSGSQKRFNSVILRQACKTDDPSMVAFILDHQLADPYDHLAMARACEKGYEEIVAIFLARHSVMTQYNPQGLYYAQLNNHTGIVSRWHDKVSSKYGADFNHNLKKETFDKIKKAGDILEILAYKKKIPNVISSEEAEYGFSYLIKKGYRFKDEYGSLATLSQRGLVFSLVTYLEKHYRKLDHYTIDKLCSELSSSLYIKDYKGETKNLFKLFTGKKQHHEALFPAVIRCYLTQHNLAPLDLLTLKEDEYSEWQKKIILTQLSN